MFSFLGDALGIDSRFTTQCAQQLGEEFKCVMYVAMRSTNLKYRAAIS
jgi:hypothetical protein